MIAKLAGIEFDGGFPHSNLSGKSLVDDFCLVFERTSQRPTRRIENEKPSRGDLRLWPVKRDSVTRSGFLDATNGANTTESELPPAVSDSLVVAGSPAGNGQYAPRAASF